jgi:hypothetical protein
MTDLNGGQLLSGDRVTIQASNSQYCSAAPPPRGQTTAGIVCNARAASAYEMFTVTKLAGGDKVIRNGDAVNFVSANGYVTAQTGGIHSLYPAGACSRACYPSMWSSFGIQNIRTRSLVAHASYVSVATQDEATPRMENNPSKVTSADEVAGYLARLIAPQKVAAVMDYRFTDMLGDGQQELLALADVQDVGRVLIVVGDTADGPRATVFAIPAGSKALLDDIVHDLDNDGIPELILEEPSNNYIPAQSWPGADIQQLAPPFWVNILRWTMNGTKDVSEQFPEFYRRTYLPGINRTITSIRDNAGSSDGEEFTVPYEVLLFKGRRLLGDQSAGLAEAVTWAYSADIHVQAWALEVLEGLPIDYPSVKTGLESLAVSPEPAIAESAHALLTRQAQ